MMPSTRRVGPTGFARGRDMTDEMLALAEKNKSKTDIEQDSDLIVLHREMALRIPLANGNVSSNCLRASA
jgi:hypothetical protein